MKPFPAETILTADAAAGQLLDTIPLVMRAIHAATRREHLSGLTLPQFRALVFIQKHADERHVSPTDLAEFGGTSLPTVSKLLDPLVRQGFIERHCDLEDRRRQYLTLTAAGLSILAAIREHTQSHLAAVIAHGTPQECERMFSGLQVLQALFARPLVVPHTHTPTAAGTPVETHKESA